MIPQRLHRTIPAGDPPADVAAWWDRWAELHPGWELCTWQDPLDPTDFPLTAPQWPRCRTGAQLAGLVRLEVLWRHGGVYVDSDVEPFGTLEGLRGCQAFAAWEDRRVVPDAVLGAVAHHPAILRCLSLAIARLDQGPWASGPGVTTEVLPGRPDVVVLPPEVFYPVHYTRRADLDGYAARAYRPPWVLGMHRWHASWLPPEART